MDFWPSRILCPIDLSRLSPLVLAWAGLFAREFGAQITVLHAVLCEPPPYFTRSQVGQLIKTVEKIRESQQTSLTQLADEVLARQIPREIEVQEAHPLEAILAWVDSTPPDLIVMGSHGRSGLSRFLLGSVSENVIRHVQCPTLIVPACRKDRSEVSVEKILCPVSLAGHDRDCIEVSSMVARKMNAGLVLLHALEKRKEDDDDPETVREDMLRKVASDYRDCCDISYVARDGKAPEQILAWIREHDIDLTVIGAVHHPLLEFTTLGTTTERVARHSSSPVLIVPARSGAHPKG